MILTEQEIDAIQLEKSWKSALIEEFRKPYFFEIKQFLRKKKSEGKVIYPPSSQIFNAFNSTPLDKVKVVILGQDPYHGAGQAMGLCFSVPVGIAMPPSLVNIFKEIHQDAGLDIPKHGNLSYWASQGVLLLNSILTVEANNAASHAKAGWHFFTDAAIHAISKHNTGVVFMLWGNFARAKKALINAEKHFILESAHPSPLSAYNGFMGCKHFSQCNTILQQQNKAPIDWRI